MADWSGVKRHPFERALLLRLHRYGTARLRMALLYLVCLSGCGGVSHHAGDARQRRLTDAMKSGEEPVHAEMIERI